MNSSSVFKCLYTDDFLLTQEGGGGACSRHVLCTVYVFCILEKVNILFVVITNL